MFNPPTSSPTNVSDRRVRAGDYRATETQQSASGYHQQQRYSQPVHQYNPELTHIRQWCPELNLVTLDDLLAHQSGIKHLETYPAPVVPVFDGEH